MEEYSGYSRNVYNQQANTNKGKRVIIYVLLGALLGSFLGGGAVALCLASIQPDTPAYIEAAVAKALTETMASADSYTANSNTVEEMVFTPEVQSAADYSTVVQRIAETVMPSVVGVRTVEDVMNFRRGITEVEGIGTGVIVSSGGLILTNQHVVSGSPKSITVTLMDGSEHDASILFANEEMDLAVIKIEATDLPTVSLGDSDSLRVGEIAVAIGNPLGLEYERSVTAGIVSALDRSILVSPTQIAQNLIQTDAAINSGNSGGPLLNASGEVIGINTYKLTTGEGMGFAIPINAAKTIVEQIISTGEFKQVQLGVSIIDKDLLSYYENPDISFDTGIYVYNIDTTSDAYASGLRSGDVITHVDGTAVDTILEFRSQLYRHVPGDSVTLSISRGTEIMTLTTVLGAA